MGGWPMIKLGHAGTWLSGGTPPREVAGHWSGEVPWLSTKDLHDYIVDDTLEHVTRSAALAHSKLMPPNTVFVATRGMALAKRLPVAIGACEMAFNQDVKALRCNDMDPRFVVYAIRGTEPSILSLTEEAAHGTKRIETDRLKGIELPYPPVDEQRAIADFLDRETQRIDALIEKKQHLLRLVHERRTAFASRMLRSLPRDSKLGHLAQWLSGGTPPRDREDLWAGDMPWASSADLGEDLDVLAETAQHVTPSAAREWSRLAPAETILIATRGMSLARRLPAVRITRTMAFNQDLKGVRLRSSMDARFAMAVLQSLEDEILSLIDEAAHGTKRLETARLMALPVPCPPLQTQRRIVATLEGNASRTRRLSEDLHTQAARLSERRQVLITEVVTGQRRIDAPSAVAA